MSTQEGNDFPTAKFEPNILDIERYLSFLAGSAGESEVFTFSIMDLESTTIIPGYGCIHAKAEEITARLLTIEPTTLHVCLNRTNLKTRKSADIVSARVIVAEIDREMSLADLRSLQEKYLPGLIVESSPGRFHLYWKIGSEVGLDKWKQIQLALSSLLGSDPSLSQVTHTIRVPGVWRVKNGFKIMPRIVFLDPNHIELTEESLNIFGDIQELAQLAVDQQKKERAQISRQLKAQKGGKLQVTAVPSQGRNNYLYSWLSSWIYESSILPGFDQTLDQANAINNKLDKPLASEEMAHIVKKLYPKACDSWELKEKKRLELLSVLVKPELSQMNSHVNGNGAHNTQTAQTLDFAYDFDSDTLLKTLPYGEAGLLRRVIQRFGAQIVSNEEEVFAFDDSKLLWKKQDKLKPLLFDFVSQAAQDMVKEEGFITFFCNNKNGELTLESIQKAQNKFAGHSVVRNTVHALCNSKDLKNVTAYDFDSDGSLFFAANGVLDLRTLELRPACADDLLLKKSGVMWKGISELCPGWIEFLGQLFEDNDEKEQLVLFIQEVFGYSICGSIDSQKLFVHHGSGSNGKSKVLDALSLLAGNYATRMGYDALSKKKGDGKETERIGAEIEGRRVVVIDDLESQIKWNEGLLKMLTSPVMIARDLYKEKKDVPNRTKFHLGCNTIPKPETENFALLRRLCLIPYTMQFRPDADKEAQIRAMLVLEGPGILAWAVRGYQRIMSRGGQMIEPECVKLQLEEYQQDNFKLENLVKELFAKPTLENPGEFIPLLDIIDELFKAMNPGEQVLYRDELSVRKIGGLICNIFGIDAERKRVNGPKERVYQLTRLKISPL